MKEFFDNTVVWWFKYLSAYHFDFGGRTSRKEFWKFMLLSPILGFLLFFVIEAFFLSVSHSLGRSVVTIVHYLLCLLGAVIVIAAQVRRLHDIGLSGKLLFIPWGFYAVWGILIWASAAETAKSVVMYAFFIADLVFLILFLMPGGKGKNQYGDPPITKDSIDTTHSPGSI